MNKGYILTKRKISQACQCCEVLWNGPRKTVRTCVYINCRNIKYEWEDTTTSSYLALRNREMIIWRILTKTKMSQACQCCEVFWNGPRKTVITCVYINCRNIKYEWEDTTTSWVALWNREDEQRIYTHQKQDKSSLSMLRGPLEWSQKARFHLCLYKL